MVSFWVDENVQKLESEADCPTSDVRNATIFHTVKLLKW